MGKKGEERITGAENRDVMSVPNASSHGCSFQITDHWNVFPVMGFFHELLHQNQIK